MIGHSLDPWRTLANTAITLTQLEAQLRLARRLMARALHAAGFTFEEIGREAGVSGERVRQWAKEEDTQ